MAFILSRPQCVKMIFLWQELFYLLDEQESDVPDGTVTVLSLIVELQAGGVSPENTKYVSTWWKCYLGDPSFITK